MGKPIPTITARAIQQMQRLGDRLAELYGETDRYKLTHLRHPLPSKLLIFHCQ